MQKMSNLYYKIHKNCIFLYKILAVLDKKSNFAAVFETKLTKVIK